MSRTVPFLRGELRYQREGDAEYLDEIVVRNPEAVHVEVMDDNCIWMGIDLADGTHIRCTFHPKDGRSHIAYQADIESPDTGGA